MAADIVSFFRRHGAILIVTLAALAMNLPQLTQETLWMDEFFSIKSAVSLSELIGSGEYIRQAGAVPAFYFLLLRGWIALFGRDIFALRLLSVLFGISGIYALFLLGAQLRNKATGLIAAFLLSIHAGHFFHSQDVRHYTLFLFLTVVLFLLFDRYLANPRPRLLRVLLLVELCLANTHFFGIFVVLAIQILHAMYAKGIDRKQWNRYHGWGLAVLGVTFLAYAGLSDDNLSSSISAIGTKSFPAQVAEIGQWLAYGGEEFAERDIYIPRNSRQFAAPLLSLVMILGAWRWSRQGRQKCVMVLCWLVVPLAALFLISKLYRPVLLQRHIFNLTPAYLLLVAAGIDWLWCRRKWAGALLLCGVAATMLPALGAQTTQVKRFPLQEAAELVRGIYRNGDIIVVEPRYCHPHFAYYLNPSYGLRFLSLRSGKPKQTPYVAQYTGDGDERFWFYLNEEVFDAFEDAVIPEPRKPVYILARAEYVLRTMTYYPRSLYPDRIIMVKNQWAELHARSMALFYNRIVRPFYRVTYSRVWPRNDITVTVFERNDATPVPPGG